MSSIAWLNPSSSKHSKWLVAYVRRNYPAINQKLRKRYLSAELFCQAFKENVESYWPDKYERTAQLIKLRNAWDQEQSRKSRKTQSLSIQLDGEVKKQFSEFVKFHKLTQAKFIEELLFHYNTPNGETDLFKTADTRRQDSLDKEKLEAEISALKAKLIDKDKEIERLKSKVNKFTDTTSSDKRRRTDTDELIYKAFEEHVQDKIKP
ncbi:hypothetical protein [Shewanella vesiculosa]|uniref:hypothetical protein n=1 Tax=Shewanella vesiculosa TaxID=518738 RepID=UPI00384D2785